MYFVKYTLLDDNKKLPPSPAGVLLHGLEWVYSTTICFTTCPFSVSMCIM